MTTRRRTAPPVSIRPVRPSDGEALTSFYAALSAESRYARFLAANRGISAGTAASFCGPDHQHREGLVAVAPAADGRGVQRIVGHLCLDPLDDGSFEMAVAVADHWRQRGIGRALLTEAIEWGGQHGVARLRATMLACNSAVLALIRSVAPSARLTMADAGVVEATIDIGSRVGAAA